MVMFAGSAFTAEPGRYEACLTLVKRDAEAGLAEADLVFSCLPTTVAPLDPGWLSPGQTLLDANYKSPRLAEVAKGAGCAYVGGRDWLLGQALAVIDRVAAERKL